MSRKQSIDRTCVQCGRVFYRPPSQITRGGGRFCSKRCYHQNHAARPLLDRFWEHVIKTDACWLWTGAALKSGGYGTIKVHKGNAIRAHCLSWELHFGPIPDGMDVCHNCPGGDNPACVNPAHLWLGTHAENMADRDAKGRCQHGERHVNAKLTEAAVRQSRIRYRDGGISIRKLASNHGVAFQSMYNAIIGRTWKHVTSPG